MRQMWSRPVYLFLVLLLLIIPGVRRRIIHTLLRNRTIRSFGLRVLLSVPAIRKKLMQQVFAFNGKKSERDGEEETTPGELLPAR
jgi:hypothetical protein